MSDYYYFDKQKRGLPGSATYKLGVEETLDYCDDICRDEIGLEVLRGEALKNATDPMTVGSVGNSAVLCFPDTDDMCEVCN